MPWSSACGSMACVCVLSVAFGLPSSSFVCRARKSPRQHGKGTAESFNQGAATLNCAPVEIVMVSVRFSLEESGSRVRALVQPPCCHKPVSLSWEICPVVT